MSKLSQWNEVLEVLATHPKTSKKLIQELEDILKPKSSAGSSLNPPKEVDGVMYYYCRFHQDYEPQENMVMSKDAKTQEMKSKGYCKASISKWNKTNSQIKKLDSSMSTLVADGKFEEAQEVAIESKELKAGLNLPENYNLEKDWEEFTK